MGAQERNYTVGINGAPAPPDWTDVQEVRCACDVGSLLGFVARRAVADPPGRRTMVACGEDPAGRLERRWFTQPREDGQGREDAQAMLMPSEPGYLALFVVQRLRKWHNRSPIGRTPTHAVLSAPANVVPCRAHPGPRLVNLADLTQRLPADLSPVRV